jgi:hypothetical protein
MGILQRHKDSIFGLSDELLTLSNAISSEASARIGADGDLGTLSTTAKDSLVNAINEVFTAAQDAGTTALKIANNLSDVASVSGARTNLDVYSTAQVDSAITDAQLALGTNYTVDTLPERDLLGNVTGTGTNTELTVGDNVFVADDGDTKWAIYKVMTIVPEDVGAGTTASATFNKIMDADVYLNAISKEAIKAAYESNPDTNALTDAGLAKLDFISATQPVNLDDVVLKAQLSQDLATTVGADVVPSADAVVAYTQAAVLAGGSVPVNETVTVIGSTITLTNEPKNGVNGILNFSAVRYTDANGVSFDAPVTAGATANEFVVSTDAADQWAGNSVQVQYVYVPAAF